MRLIECFQACPTAGDEKVTPPVFLHGNKHLPTRKKIIVKKYYYEQISGSRQTVGRRANMSMLRYWPALAFLSFHAKRIPNTMQ
jgi:hypothetical protein